MLYLRDSNEVESAAHAIIERVSELLPTSENSRTIRYKVWQTVQAPKSYVLRLNKTPSLAPNSIRREGGVEWQIGKQKLPLLCHHLIWR